MFEQQLIEYVPLPAVIVDCRTLAILAANDTAARYYGYPKPQLLAKTLADIAAPDAPALDPLAGPSPVTCRQRARGGESLDVEAYWHEIPFLGCRAALGLMLDANRHRHMNRAKDQFLATLSHELRTPLNAILGWTQTLQGGDIRSDTLARALAQIEQSAHAQARLVDDLLNVSDIVAGRLRLEVRPMRLKQTIDAAIETLRPAIEAKELRLETSFESGADVIAGDCERIRQVVWNLLSNAVKFTPRLGTVRVRLGRTESSAVIEVSDDGEGIAPGFLPHVFERFRQADASSRKRHGGLGLGLSIARDLVELHGGTVTAGSAGPGRGSTFIVHLPIASGRAESSRPARPNGRSRQLTGLRILTVDDDRNTREMLREALERAGAQVLAAESARDALRKLKKFRPDVLVSDIGMPDEDGYDLLRQVRVLPRDLGGATPAIALTGYARDEDRAATRNAGYQAVTPKPVNLDELLSTIAAVAEQGSHP